MSIGRKLENCDVNEALGINSDMHIFYAFKQLVRITEDGEYYLQLDQDRIISVTDYLNKNTGSEDYRKVILQNSECELVTKWYDISGDNPIEIDGKPSDATLCVCESNNNSSSLASQEESELSPTEIELDAGESQLIEITLKDSSGNSLSDNGGVTGIDWIVENGASVSNTSLLGNGKITATVMSQAAGEYTIEFLLLFN